MIPLILLLFAIPQGYDYGIGHNDTTTILFDFSNATTIITNPYGYNDSIVFNTAIQKLNHINGSSLFIDRGFYNLNNTVLTIPPYTRIQGDLIGDGVNKESGTNLHFTNGGAIVTTWLDDIENMRINYTKNDSSDSFVIRNTSLTLHNIWIYGSEQQKQWLVNAQGPFSQSGGYVGNMDWENVYVYYDPRGVLCNHCSENDFHRVHIGGYDIAGLYLKTSDNNHSDYLYMSGNCGATDIYYGDSSNGTINGGTGDNDFNHVLVPVSTPNCSHTNFVINDGFNYTDHVDIRPNHIDMLAIDGCVTITYNHNTQGQLDLEHTSYPRCNGK